MAVCAPPSSPASRCSSRAAPASTQRSREARTGHRGQAWPPTPTPATPAGQPTPARPASGDGDTAAADDAAPGRAERREAPELRPYDRVITKDAKSDPGVFTVHRIRDRVYYEIPKDMLGREFLWVSQIASTTAGAGFGGQAAGNRVVRWERRDRRVLLRSVSYDMVADRGPADRARRHRGQLRHDPDGLPDRDDGQERRAGHRGLAAVHDRGARVQRPGAAARPRLRLEPRLRRARQGVPDQRRGPRHPHLHDAERAASAGGGGPAPAPGPQRDRARGPAAPAC